MDKWGGRFAPFGQKRDGHERDRHQGERGDGR